MKIHIGANTGYIEFDEGQNGWTEKNIRFILNQLESLSLWKEIKYIKGAGSGAAYYILPSTQDQLVALLLNNPDLSGFSRASFDKEELNLINIVVGGNGGYIKIIFNLDIESSKVGILIENIKEILLNFYTYFSEVAELEPTMGIYTSSILYQRPSRPTADDCWRFNNLVDIGIDNLWDNEGESYQYENYKKIKTLALPSTAKRTYKNGIVIIEWGDNWKNEQKISKALEVREQWLCDNLDIRQFDFRFNEFGDRWDNTISLNRTISNDSDITLYQPITHKTYKSAVLDSKSKELDLELIDLIKSWKIKKQSKVGTPISSICLLLPDRDSALHASTKYADLFQSVLYVDNRNKLWEVNPSTFMNG